MKVINLLETIADTCAKNDVKVRTDLGYDYEYFYNTLLLYLIKSIPKGSDITNLITNEVLNLYELEEENLSKEIPNRYYVYYINAYCGEYIIKGYITYSEAMQEYRGIGEEVISMIIYKGEVIKFRAMTLEEFKNR